MTPQVYDGFLMEDAKHPPTHTHTQICKGCQVRAKAAPQSFFQIL